MKNTFQNKFSSTVFLTAAVLLVGSIIFNALIDPYRMFEWLDRPGFNRFKPAIFKRMRLLKAYEVRRLKPDSVLLGSSRCHLAFSPNNAIWKEHADRPYNLAFDGAMTKEMYYYLRHAQSVHPVKLVLLGIDLYHPTDTPATTRPDFDPSILGVDSRVMSLVRFFLSDLKILTSFDTLANSIATLRGQDSDEGEWLAPNGQRLGEVFFRRPSENFMQFGPRYYFDEINKLEVQYKLEWKVPVKTIKVYPPKEEKKDAVSSIGYIRKIVEFCRQKNIELKIFFTPSHVTQMELSKILNEWPMIEKGKRDLVSFMAEDAARHPGEKAIELYDFSGYSIYTTEILPPVGSQKEMQYYWDSSHFKEIVGDKVLERIFLNDKTKAKGEDFGVLLNLSNFENAINKIHRDSLWYEARNPDVMMLLQKYTDDYKREHHINE